MKIPEVFFGNKKVVRSKLNIIVNKIFKNNLAEQFNKIHCINTDSLDNFTINYNIQYYWMSFKNCFYLSEFTRLLFHSEKYSIEEKRRIVNENIEYLSKTSWGNLILNDRNNYFIVNEYKYNYDEFYNETLLNRSNCIIILKGILENYKEYEINKNSIYNISEEKFPNVEMLYHYIIVNCQMGREEIKSDYNSILNIYEKINDNNYWNKLIEKREEKIKKDKEQRIIEHKKWLNEEIGWYKNELEKRKI
jgi:hypothetical protein